MQRQHWLQEPCQSWPIFDPETGEKVCLDCGQVLGPFILGIASPDPKYLIGMRTNQAELDSLHYVKGSEDFEDRHGLGSREANGSTLGQINYMKKKDKRVFSRFALRQKHGTREVYARSGRGNQILLVASGPEREAEASPASPPPGRPSFLDLPEVLEHYKYCDRHL